MSEFKIERKVQRQGKAGYSFTVVIPKAVASHMGLLCDSIIGFCLDKDNNVIIKKKVDD